MSHSRGSADEVAELAQFRERAARCSGGTSSSVIKKLVIRLIKERGLTGAVLDYGAGVGELISMLAPLSGLDVYGADIMPRPAFLTEPPRWFQIDLNNWLDTGGLRFDIVICSEVIEHLENPRATFRNIASVLKAGGSLVLTMPNQENIRSYLNLIFRGHFAAFQGQDYPAHITALLRRDIERICAETGFTEPSFDYTDEGWMPITRTTWQRIFPFGLGGRLFSDNLAAVARKLVDRE